MKESKLAIVERLEKLLPRDLFQLIVRFGEIEAENAFTTAILCAAHFCGFTPTFLRPSADSGMISGRIGFCHPILGGCDICHVCRCDRVLNLQPAKASLFAQSHPIENAPATSRVALLNQMLACLRTRLIDTGIQVLFQFARPGKARVVR